MLARRVHRLSQIKAFQPFSVTYIHTVVLETLIDNVKLKFFYLSVFWGIITYILTAFPIIFLTQFVKNGHPLLGCLLRPLLLTTRSIIVQISSTIWQFFFGLNGQRTIEIDT